jgi:hypothetical protein
VNPEIDMMYGWKELGIGSRVGVLEGIDYYQTPNMPNQGDIRYG